LGLQLPGDQIQDSANFILIYKWQFAASGVHRRKPAPPAKGLFGVRVNAGNRYLLTVRESPIVNFGWRATSSL
jgi:hypothetical protein